MAWRPLSPSIVGLLVTALALLVLFSDGVAAHRLSFWGHVKPPIPPALRALMFGGDMHSLATSKRHDQNKYYIRANASSFDPSLLRLANGQRARSDPFFADEHDDDDGDDDDQDEADQPFCHAFADAKPVFLTTEYACPDRFYCPNIKMGDPTTKPQMCPPSLECMRLRLQLTYCDPQGRYEPIICPKSMYCPTPSELLPCPKDHYCPWGTQHPIPCGWGADCPEGSHKNTVWLGLLVCGIVDAIMLIIYSGLYISRKCKSRVRHVRALLPSFHNGPAPDTTTTTPPRQDRDGSGGIASRTSVGVPSTKMLYRRSSEPVVLVPPTPVASTRWQTMVANIKWFLKPRAPQPVTAASAKALTKKISKRRPPATYALKGSTSTLAVAPEDQVMRPVLEDGQPHPAMVQGFRDVMQGDHLQLMLRFENLGLVVKGEKTILKDVSGHITPGRVTVIMGPSGAGKSTFMNVLMGKKGRTSGHLYVNGQRTEMAGFRKLIGFVPQDDIMLSELTVRENIEYAAKIRLPSGWSASRRKTFVEAVLATLDLDHVDANLCDGEISGGQRKRVNIGMELAAVPVVIFLDEPTSGLDATAALKIAHTLKVIASLGISVITVIHQPRTEIFDTFDDVILLVPGGRLAYLGAKDRVQPYFEALGYEFPTKVNPADVLMDILSGKGHRPGFAAPYTADDLVTLWSAQPALQPSPSDQMVHSPIDSSATLYNQTDDDLNTASIEEGLFGPSRNEGADIASVLRQVDTRHVATRQSTAPTGPAALAKAERTKKQKEKSILKIAKGRGASFFAQMYHAHNRSVVQQYRRVNAYVMEVAVAVVTGILMGMAVYSYDGALYQGLLIEPYTLISPSPIEITIPMMSMVVGCAIGLAGAPAGTKIFSEERDVYFREAGSGHRALAYYIAKLISSTYRFVLSSLHFTSLLIYFANPNIAFYKLFLIHCLQFYCVYGLSYMVAMMVRRENATLFAVVLTVFAAVFCGNGPSITQARSWGIGWLMEISFDRWASEAWYTEEVTLFRGVYEVDRISATIFGYTLDRYWMDLVWIAVIGTTFRVIAYLMMIGLQRSKQK